MKRLGKKLSFLTKIMLVLGLIITDLAPLKIVFAYEKAEALAITVNEDKLNIMYNEELTDEYVDIVVNETYTYLDETQEIVSNTYTDVLVTDLNQGLDYETIVDDTLFNGTYNVEVKLERKVEGLENELIATNDYNYEKSFEEGIVLSVQDGSTNPVLPTDEVYHLDPLNTYNTVIKFNAGGLAPTWSYTYNEEVFTGVELLNKVIIEPIDFTGHLKGEHKLGREVVLSSEHFEADKVFTKEITLMYGKYTENNDMLNNSVTELGLNNTYKFTGETKEGILYVYPDLENNKLHNVLDVINILRKATGDSELISFTVSNGTEELQNKYLEYQTAFVEGTETMLTEEEFYSEYTLDDNYVITLNCKDLTITYKVVCFGDTNEDGIVTAADLTTIIDKVLEIEKSKLPNDDLTNDNKLNLSDAVYLLEVLKTKNVNVTLGTETGSISAYLNNTKKEIVSGDTFDVEYIVSVEEFTTNGIKGLINYDKNLFELVSIKNNTSWLGNNKDGKFLYLGENSLERKLATKVEEDNVDNTENKEVLPEEETEETTPEESIPEEPVVTYEKVDYVVLKLTFKAKKAGTGNISINDYKFVDGVNTVALKDEKIELAVTINASTDNSLKSLKLGENSIELQEGILDYELTVANDVTTLSVEALTNDANATITSIVNPEELVEGENTITVSVTAENGDVKIYTIKVTREAAPEEEPEEEKKEVVTTNRKPAKNDDEKEEEPKVEEPAPEPTDDNDEEKDKKEGSKLSRIIIIILILLVIAGLIYLIFKDNDDDDETKKANKEIDKIKKADEEKVKKEESKVNKPETKTNKYENKKTTSKKTNNNKKKERR